MRIENMTARRQDTTLARVDASSWISWGCYALGFALSLDDTNIVALRGGGPQAVVLVVAVALFFAIVAVIQRQMRVSLFAQQYGYPRKLVTGGVFSMSRNPIYVAFLLPLASLACLSFTAAVVAIASYLLAMTQFVIRHEESVLEAEFGETYRDYRARVPRWLGWF